MSWRREVPSSGRKGAVLLWGTVIWRTEGEESARSYEGENNDRCPFNLRLMTDTLICDFVFLLYVYCFLAYFKTEIPCD
jgi:hypothetical protein